MCFSWQIWPGGIRCLRLSRASASPDCSWRGSGIRSRSPDDAASAGRLPVQSTRRRKPCAIRSRRFPRLPARRAQKLAGATSSGIERASDIASDARRQLRQASSSAQSMARERPLAVGAAAFAIGAAVAFAFLTSVESGTDGFDRGRPRYPAKQATG